MMPEPFIFTPTSRCHQERPYFQGWVLNPGEVSPEFATQPPYSPEYGTVGPSQTSNRLEALTGRLSRRKGVPPKKERRRTESINSAFAELRECIPNVPADTKLSKIKTLRLATSYIGYLMDVLAKDSEPGGTEGFKAELKKVDTRDCKRKREGVSRDCKHNKHVFKFFRFCWVLNFLFFFLPISFSPFHIFVPLMYTDF